MLHKWFLAFLIILFDNFSTKSQETDNENVDINNNGYISWVSEFPATTRDSKNMRFTDKVAQLIFGKKIPQIVLKIA